MDFLLTDWMRISTTLPLIKILQPLGALQLLSGLSAEYIFHAQKKYQRK